MVVRFKNLHLKFDAISSMYVSVSSKSYAAPIFLHKTEFNCLFLNWVTYLVSIVLLLQFHHNFTPYEKINMGHLWAVYFPKMILSYIFFTTQQFLQDTSHFIGAQQTESSEYASILCVMPALFSCSPYLAEGNGLCLQEHAVCISVWFWLL